MAAGACGCSIRVFRKGKSEIPAYIRGSSTFTIRSILKAFVAASVRTAHAEPLEDMLQMLLHSTRAYEKNPANLTVGLSLNDEQQHFGLSPAESETRKLSR